MNAPTSLPLRVASDRRKEKRLLPRWRMPRTVEPRIGRLAWASKGSNDLGGGIPGKRFSEGHREILPEKEMYAMRKINLDIRLQCGQITCMTTTTKIKKFRSKHASEAAVEECCKQGWKAGMRGNSESGWTVNAITTASGYRITYDLHTDGCFHEYSRKEVVL